MITASSHDGLQLPIIFVQERCATWEVTRARYFVNEQVLNVRGVLIVGPMATAGMMEDRHSGKLTCANGADSCMEIESIIPRPGLGKTDEHG